MNRSLVSHRAGNPEGLNGLQLWNTLSRIKGLMSVSILLAFALLLFCAGPVSAQVPTGAILGTVKDMQSLPVEGASVTLTNQGTNYEYKSITSSNGGYQFRSIDYGLYKVSVSKDGFKSGVVENIKLDASTEYTVAPLMLEVGARTESVVVEAGAETIQSSNAEVTGTVEKKQIEDLPILDRNPLALLNLQAGFNSNGATDAVINGQRTSFSNLTLDGINIQDNFFRDNGLTFSPNLPFNSQAQEFTITSQNGDVDKGGSSQVSIVTPKGSNNWHGEGFWFYRSNGLGAANDWFNAASGVPIPRLLQNQGGGNLGGPIKKDKLFIYGYYELLRLRQESIINTTVLSPAIVTALAGGTPTVPFTFQPIDPNTGNPVGTPNTVDLLSIQNTNFAANNPCVPPPACPANPFPVYTADPAILALLARVPNISNNNRIGDGVNLLGYQFNQRSNRSRYNYGFRADYNFSSKNTFTGTWSYNHDIVDRPDADVSFDRIPAVTNSDGIKFLSTAWRYNPTANVTNEVRFGFNLAPAFFATSEDFSRGFLISGLATTNPDPNFLPQGRNTRTWAWQDNASWVHGNHLVKFGGQLQRTTIFSTFSGGIIPDYQLGFSDNNNLTPVPTDFGPAGTELNSTDLVNAKNLLATVAGILSNVAQTFNVTSQSSQYVPGAPLNRNYSQNDWSFYLGDTWRINRKLTLTYGTRWEYFSPVNEKNGLALLPVAQPGQTITQALLSDATVDFAGGPSKRGLYNPRMSQFAPNLGLAWDPFGNGKTAVRAGFSMNYVNDGFFAVVDAASSLNPGLSTLNTADPFGLPDGFTVSSPATVAVPQFGIPTSFSQNANNLGIGNNVGYAIDPNLKAPYLEQWNLSIQRDIGANTSLTVSYVGNHGVGLFRAVDVNQVIIGPNGFLADFNRARADGFLAQSLAPNAAGCTGPGTQNQCGFFNPAYQGLGSQPLTVFPNICGTNLWGVIGPADFDPANLGLGGLGFLNNDIQQGFAADLADIYHVFSCAPPGFFAQNDLIEGGDLLKDASFSTYHAGVVELRRRLSSGIYFQANYVFSKVMTDYAASFVDSSGQTRFQPYLDNANVGFEKARAPFDITHAFKANFTYELPIGKGHRFSSSNRLAGLLLNGWQTGSVFTWQSGNPYSILSGQPTINRAGTRSDRNTAVATLSHGQISSDLGVFVQPGGIVYGINPKLISPDGTGAPASAQLSCTPAVTGGFCNPQPGQIGNLQNYAFSGPAYFDWDLSAEKSFNFTERFKFAFRTEAFNVLNHPVFFMGNQNINSKQFGQSTSTVSTPRILQMSLRLKF
jgi:hypothetical protein